MISDEFKSRQIYPSPKGSFCTIEVHLPEEATISLGLLNEQGKISDQIIDKVKFGPGRHEIEIDRAKFDGTLCFYRLAMLTDKQEIVDTKKIVVNGNI